MLIDAMENAAFLCHIHPHAGIKAIKKLLTNRAHFFERLAPKESFGLHNQTVIHPIRFDLEEIIERPERRRSDKFISVVTIPETAPARNYMNLRIFRECL